jgi:hypothetical protein
MSLPNEVNLQLLASSKAYNIDQSLRFRRSASANLTRSLSAPTNNKKFTWSAWVKRGSVTAGGGLFDAYLDGVNFSTFHFTNAGALQLYNILAGDDSGFLTTALFRDSSSWYHIVFVYDSANATAADRAIVYVNGVRQVVTNPYGQVSSNEATYLNNTYIAYIGRYVDAGNYFDGYMAEVNFIDGQALTPSSLGETDSQTGVWKPKKYSGTYGTNGFYLPFSDNSGVTSTTLGKDSSGNSNNFTPNNFSVTAGTTYDWMRDSPTLGTLASNYATLNNVIPGAAVINGGLTRDGSSGRTSCSTIPLTSGKYYFETTIQDNNGNGGVGVKQSTAHPLGDYDTSKCATYFANGEYKIEGNSQTSGFSSYASGDVIGCAVDTTQSPAKIWWHKNNTWQGTGNPTTAGYSLTSGLDYLFMVLHGSGSSSTTASVNFGQQPWAYTPPTGYSALNTFNLPTPTIGATASTQANKNFDTVVWTGDNTSGARTITGLNFQPDFVWGKCRSVSYTHGWHDSVRGSAGRLCSNNTSTEDTNFTYGYVSSMNSDGFTTSPGGTDNQNWNQTSATYVAWCWKAASANTTNTDGARTSTIRANPSAGFSIVTFTVGNSGTNTTVGHGLGAVPKMIISKARTKTYNWDIYHSDITVNGAGRLTFTSNNYDSGNNPYGSVAPTSSVFTFNEGFYANGDTVVSYCFSEIAGYSAFGKYTGNGSSDGPFIYTGFKPKWILFKTTSAGPNGWNLIDTARNTYNPGNSALQPDSSGTEGTNSAQDVDFLSNGFKLRGTSANQNMSGQTEMYAAFAENPFKYSLAR